MSKTQKWLALALLTLTMFSIGYFRHDFFDFCKLWLGRGDLSANKYPMGYRAFYHSLLNRPEWTIALIYNQLYGAVSASMIWVWFQEKSYFKKTWLVFLCLEILCVLLLILFALMGSRTVNNFLVVEIRNFIQSPLFVMVMVFYFRQLRKANA